MAAPKKVCISLQSNRYTYSYAAFSCRKIVRNRNRTSGPQKNTCQKNAMGKLQTKVCIHTGRNSMPGRLKISVAQKLIMGHMKATVTEARTTVIRMG